MMPSSTFAGTACDHLGVDVAGADHVHGDALLGVLLRQRLGEADQAGLGGGVVHLPHLPLLAVDRGDVDDAAIVPLAHALDGQAAEVEGGGEVDADDVVPLLAGHAVERGVAGDAGIVDQHVDRSEILGDGGDAVGAGVVVADIPFVAL